MKSSVPSLLALAHRAETDEVASFRFDATAFLAEFDATLPLVFHDDIDPDAETWWEREARLAREYREEFDRWYEEFLAELYTIWQDLRFVEVEYSYYSHQYTGWYRNVGASRQTTWVERGPEGETRWGGYIGAKVA